MIDFRTAKKLALQALYEHMLDDGADSEWIPIESIQLRIGERLPYSYLRKALDSLEEEDLADSIEDPAGGKEYTIVEHGILTVQQTFVSEPQEVLPQGVTELAKPRFLVSEGPVSGDFEGREGDIHLELLPASDRMVPINHNQPEYEEIRSGINELYEEFRSANDLEIDSLERERILSSLAGAKALWKAAQLKIIQIKVGIILAVQDAIAVLKNVGKATAPALLVSAIKAFVKHTTGIEL